MDPYIVLGSAVIGFLVGMTGAGGGALMTPMLILLFGVKPSTAISSDLVAAVVMRPIGAAVHLRQGTVNLRLVGWMMLGSVPMAFLGAYLLHLIGSASSAETPCTDRARSRPPRRSAAAMVLRFVLDRRAGQHTPGHRPRHRDPASAHDHHRDDRRPHRGDHVGRLGIAHDRVPAVPLSPDRRQPTRRHRLGAGRPLTAAAALGALAFGHVELSVTTSLIVGSVPAVLVGSLLSSRAPDRYVRPAITFVIFASGLKYVGVGTTALGWVLCSVLLVVAVIWLVSARPWQKEALSGLGGDDLSAVAPGPD